MVALGGRTVSRAAVFVVGVLLALVATVILVMLLLISGTRNRGRDAACESVLVRNSASVEMMEFHLDQFEMSSKHEMSHGTSAGSRTHENAMRNLSHRAPKLLDSLRDCATDLVKRQLISPENMVALERDARILDDAYLLVRRPPEWFRFAAPPTDASACLGRLQVTCLVPCVDQQSKFAESVFRSIDAAFAMATSLRDYDLQSAESHELAWERTHQSLLPNIRSYGACLSRRIDGPESPISTSLDRGLEWEKQAKAHAPFALQTLREILEVRPPVDRSLRMGGSYVNDAGRAAAGAGVVAGSFVRIVPVGVQG